MKRRPKVPSFAGLKPASPLCSWIKKANTSRNTRHEVALQNELSELGLRFQRNVGDVPGRPDIVFAKAHLAVFCDKNTNGRRGSSRRRRSSERMNQGLCNGYEDTAAPSSSRPPRPLSPLLRCSATPPFRHSLLSRSTFGLYS